MASSGGKRHQFIRALQKLPGVFAKTTPTWRLAISFAGFVMVLAALRMTQSYPPELFSTFLSNNRKQLALFAAGLLLWIYAAISEKAPLVLDGAPTADEPPQEPTRRRFPLLSVSGGVGVLVAAAWLYAWTIRQILHSPEGLLQVGAFFAAVILMVAGVALVEAPRSRGWFRDLGLAALPKSSKWYQQDYPYLAVFLAVFATLAVYRLNTRPGWFHFDEATTVFCGRVVRYPIAGYPVLPGWSTLFFPYLSATPNAVIADLMPNAPYMGARLFTVVTAVASLLLLFVFARSHFGRTAAWFVLIIAGTNHTLTAFSRLALNNMQGVFLMIGWAMAALAARRSRRASHGLLAGVFSGLAYYTYQGALLSLPLGMAFLFLEAVRQPVRAIKRSKPYLALVFAFALTAAPIHVFHRNNQAALYGRQSNVSIFSKANIEYGFWATGKSTIVQLYLGHAWAATGGTLLWFDFSTNYRYWGLPNLDRDSAALLLLGLVGAGIHARRRGILKLLALWCGVGIVLSSFITMPTPHMPRTLMLFPAFCLLCGWALSVLCQRARLVNRRIGIVMIVACAALTAQIGARNWNHYYRKYLSDLSHPNYTATAMGFMDFLQKFPRDAHMVYYAGFLDQINTSPYSMWDMNWTREFFLDPLAPVPEPSPTAPRTAYIVRHDAPNFQPAENAIKAKFPNAIPEPIHDPYRGDVPPTHMVYWVERAGPPVSGQ